MKFFDTQFEGVRVIEPDIRTDKRGYFYRAYCKEEFEAIEIQDIWVQSNYSFSKYRGTVRGLHFQLDPFAECKLIRCIKGSIFDVIVDLRENSNTYLNWFSIELNEKNNKAIYIPEGFAHGFQSLQDNSALIYMHSNFYNPNYERGLRYNDPKLSIDWPLQVSNISERDLSFPLI